MKYPFIKQFDTSDCAAACMAMVCKFYKKDISIAKLRDIMGTDMKGTNLLGLGECAGYLGMQSQAIRIDEKSFFSSFTLPAISNVVTKEGLSHFVVIYQITEKYVRIGDPAKGILRMPAKEFLAQFTGALMLLAPTEQFEKESYDKGVLLRQYVHLIMPYKRYFLLAMLASFLGVGFGIVLSLLNNTIYDEVLPFRDMDKLLAVLLAFLGISLTAAMIQFGKQWVLLHLGLKIDWPLMMGYFEHIFHLPMRFFRTRKIGEITTRVSDAFVIKNVFNSIALSAIMDVTMMLFSGAMLLRMNGKLFLIQLLMIGLCAVLIYLFKPFYKRLNEEQMQQNALLNSELIESLSAIETIKTNTLENLKLLEVGKRYRDTLRTGYREGMLSNIQGVLSNALSQLGNAVLLYVGMYQIIRGEMTLGGYMAFMALSGYFSTPMNNIVGLQLSLQEANISLYRLSEILDYEREGGKETTCQELPEGDICFRNVSYRYGMRKPVLQNMTFTVPKGKKVALVGPSGCGKTTLLQLLLKFDAPYEGDIFYGAARLSDLDEETVRKGVSYVPQNVELFSKTLLDNIMLGKPGAEEAEIIRAVKMAGADTFIEKLPLQYQTYLEEAGKGLSGGEKQRIGLARAFLKDAPVYILDECTCNLDLETEQVILNTLYEKLQDKTVLIAAHRLSTIRDCDCILFLEQGKIVEQGTHEELLALNGRYKKLWDMQNGI